MNMKRIPILLGVMVASTLLAFPKEGSGPNAETKRTSGEPALVLGGLDAVSLVKGKKERGKEALSIVYEGHAYHFSSRGHLESFQSQPDRYAVRAIDPVVKSRSGRQVSGKPEIFAVHDGKIYLFMSEDTRRVFEKSPREFVEEKKGNFGPREGSQPQIEGSSREGS